ncbi:MFS transporter [Pyruvatibacter mobilis]|jgi:Na+/melibiose symporter-like transporter|uniref:MFS transporter n=1 Tax=Pyruvatibacter mobilis TaxID=1712261 RepID=A0A845QES1_9HYPH|nr:MFS transporter [Pyruvatibacter mobilis]NBG96929.1 MFS transporter [Pyruvatibacter mobilis]QJD74693.1 MFS transporter [Pyruvatibacter mobilis]GGD09353.1 MFS transporter [Pyruvatibacter mobilis]
MSSLSLTPLRLLAFASPAIPIAAMGLPISVYLPPFYANEMGLGLALVGTIFMLARFWDVFTDPVLGVLSDKFVTRWGRRRHWIVLSVPIMLLATVMLFMPTAPVSGSYLLIWMVVLYVGWTLLTLSHMSWGAELTPDYNERSLVQGWREGALILGMLLVLITPAVIDYLGAEDVGKARVAAMGWFVVILLPITVAFAVTTVGERDVPPPKHVPFREAVGVMLRNRYLRRLLAADLANGLGSGTMAALFIFVASDVLQMGGWSSVILLAYFGAGVIFVPLIVRLSYRFGKHLTLAVSALANGIGLPLMYLVGPGDVLLMVIFTALFGINLGAGSFLLRSVMADVADHDQVETGNQRTGLFFSLLTMTSKVGAAIAVGVTYALIDGLGFMPGKENTPQALEAVRATFIWLPTLMYFAVAGIMWHFPLDEARQKENRRIIMERAEREPPIVPFE